MRRFVNGPAFLLVPGLLFCIGCSSFESKWTAAGKIPTPPDGIEGRWQGSWTSDVNGHTGGLRCVLARASEGGYLADFHATFWKIFSAAYSLTLHVKATDGGADPMIVYFTGDSDLGWLAGGKYQYDGRASPTAFFADYKSAQDHGKFQMTRPGGATVAYRRPLPPAQSQVDARRGSEN